MKNYRFRGLKYFIMRFILCPLSRKFEKSFRAYIRKNVVLFNFKDSKYIINYNKLKIEFEFKIMVTLLRLTIYKIKFLFSN